jgi:hypothetical protein
MKFWGRIFGRTSPLASSSAGVVPKRTVRVRNEAEPKYLSATPSQPVTPKGKDFERDVERLLQAIETDYPLRVKVVPQMRIKLHDSRVKVVDFALDYTLASSRHQVALECQDRDSWSTEILDKILAIRNYSNRNRFWFVYRDELFLTSEAKALLDKHGVLHFSLSELDVHLQAVRFDLHAAEMAKFMMEKWNEERRPDYKPPSDPYML